MDKIKNNMLKHEFIQGFCDKIDIEIYYKIIEYKNKSQSFYHSYIFKKNSKEIKILSSIKKIDAEDFIKAINKII